MPHTLTAAALALASLSLGACSIDIDKHEAGHRKDVSIRTPAGALSVKTAVSADGTGLAVYPNAWPAREHGRNESADVDINTAWFGVKVVAAKFESDDAPEKVLAFYRGEMASHAPFVECRGKVRWHDDERPTCRERSTNEVQLASGIEERQRMVSVKPDGDGGTEFALVYVATND